jgi:transposase
MKKTRVRHPAKFITKVAIEVIKEKKTLADMSVMFGMTQQLISNWKNEFLYQSTVLWQPRDV